MNVFESASREEILKFKLACKGDELTDEQVDHLFLNFRLQGEDEIAEILDILIRFRPKIYDKHERQISG